MKRFVALLALSLAACTPARAAVVATPTATTSQHISEDSPDWNCSTMGNLRCGEEMLIGAEQAGMVALWIASGRPCAPTAQRSTDGGCEPINAVGTALSCTAEGCVER